MVPFAYPLALLGLLSLPVLTGIYLLRNRARRTPVSSLMLWQLERSPKQGGLRLDRLLTPWLFLLELLILALLAVAAASPLVPRRNHLVRTVVVLDDSYSMLARDADGVTPRERATDIVMEMADDSAQVWQFVLAGAEPAVPGRETVSKTQVRSMLDQWSCLSPRADLPAALARAKTLAGARGRLLVLSDQPPPQLDEQDRLVWHAVGRPLPNVGFVGAARTTRGESDRFLLEVQNFADKPLRASLTLKIGDQTQVRRIALPASGRVALPSTTAKQRDAVVASLPTDALDVDNRVVLLPTSRPRIRVRNAVANPRLRDEVRQVLEATERAAMVDASPELWISDQPGTVDARRTWSLHLLSGEEGRAFVGPFLSRSDHPLTDGLALPGEVWSASADGELPGTPVISAGNTVLLSDERTLSSLHRIHMRINPRTSTVLRSPAWPILFYNLLAWRDARRTGLAEPNVRLGQTARLTLPRGGGTLKIEPPGRDAREVRAAAEQFAFVPARPGLHTLRVGQAEHRLAVNAMDADESNLRACAAGRFGSWIAGSAGREDYASLSWVLVLLALVLLVAHQALIKNRRTRTMK